MKRILFKIKYSITTIKKLIEFYYLVNLKFYRKRKGGTWYKHQFTERANYIGLIGCFWARFPKNNEFTEIIETEFYDAN